MYKRYVDDIFCIFENERDGENFFEFLKCHHKNIIFSFEKERINFYHFFIFLYKNKGNQFSTSVY